MINVNCIPCKHLICGQPFGMGGQLDKRLFARDRLCLPKHSLMSWHPVLQVIYCPGRHQVLELRQFIIIIVDLQLLDNYFIVCAC